MKQPISRAMKACVALLAAAFLCGCGTWPGRTANGADLTGGLLVVRLLGRADAPPAVRVDLSLLRESGATAIAGRRQQSVPGRYADYLVSLPLAPQRYVITALHEVREPNGGNASPAVLLATLTAPFEVTAKGPVYLGRLVVAAEGQDAAVPIQVEDHYDEDTLLFRSAIAPLRDVPIARTPIANESLVSALSGAQVSAGDPARKQLTVDTITADAQTAQIAQSALSPSAREAFAKFLRLRPPRAFAVGGAGAQAFGFSSGTGAVDRALRDCGRAAPGHACRLFAVDDLLMSSLTCGVPTGTVATAAASASSTAAATGCNAPAVAASSKR